MLGTVLNALHKFLNLILTQLSEQGVVSVLQITNPKLKKNMLLSPKSQDRKESDSNIVILNFRNLTNITWALTLGEVLGIQM